MPVETKKDFFLALRKCKLLAPDQFAIARDAVEDSDDVIGIANRLCKDGRLTPWQAKNVLAGKTSFHVANYTLVDVLGQGKMGTVFKACQAATGRIVALKLMSAAINNNRRMVARFKREIRIVSGLRHPNVVSALDAGRVSDRYFLVTEYVPGKDLLHWIRAKENLPVEWASECVRQGLLGLQYIHEKGLIHRDIKPSNLMVTADSLGKMPHVKVLDLGLGRFVESADEGEQLTRDGHTVGTIDFMAPEQVQSGRAADIRSDIYAFGCTLYQALTRQLPFQGDNLAENIAGKLTKDPRRLQELRADVPAGLGEIVARMLSRIPDKRPSCPRQAAEALAAYSMAKTAAAPVKPAAANGKRLDKIDQASADRLPSVGVAQPVIVEPTMRESVRGAPGKPSFISGKRARPRLETLVMGLLLAVSLLCVLVWFDLRDKTAADVSKMPVESKASMDSRAAAARLLGTNTVADKPLPLLKIEGVINVGPQGHFKTINEAIDYVRKDGERRSAWTSRTIKVAGWQTLSERIHVDNSDLRFPKELRIVCVDSRPAILSPQGPGPVIRLNDIEHFVLEGFEIDASQSQSAIELEGFLVGTRLSKLDIRGIRHTGISIRGAEGLRPPKSRCVLEKILFRGDGPAATGLCFENQVNPSSNLTVASCRFFGPLESAIKISGPIAGIDIRESIFSQARLGVFVRGNNAIKELSIINNSFYRLDHGAVFDEMPLPSTRKLALQRNLFAKLNGAEMRVGKGFDGAKFTTMFERGGMAANWTDRPRPDASATGEVDIFVDNGKTGATFQFESDDPVDPYFLRPLPKSPHKSLGAIIVK